MTSKNAARRTETAQIREQAAGTLSVTIPLRIRSQAHGASQHWAVRARERKRQRQAVEIVVVGLLHGAGYRRPLPGRYDIQLVRIIGPRGRELDSDNRAFALKSCRDGVADAFGRSDGPSSGLNFLPPTEERGKDWAVRVEIRGAEVTRSEQ